MKSTVVGSFPVEVKEPSSTKETFDIPVSGRLFVKDNYTVSNAKGN